MRTMSLKFNTYVRNINVVNNNIDKLAFNSIIWTFGVLAILYILCLGNMVKNIVERKSIESKVSALSNEVQNLELTYLSMSNSVDLELSHSMGFKEAKTVFATHKSIGFKSSDGVKLAQNEL